MGLLGFGFSGVPVSRGILLVCMTGGRLVWTRSLVGGRRCVRRTVGSLATQRIGLPCRGLAIRSVGARNV